MSGQTGSHEIAQDRLAVIMAYIEQLERHEPGAASGLLECALEMDVERILKREYDAAISSLCQCVRETQSPAAYLLLVEAYARSEQSELALVTLDVLSYVEPEMVEAQLVKGYVLRETGRSADARQCFERAAVARPSSRAAWRALIDMALERGEAHEAARLLNDALRNRAVGDTLTGIQGSLAAMEAPS